MPLPTEIIGLNRSDVTFVWEDGHESVYPARELRLRCRCALCIEEMTGEKILEASKVPADVVATGMDVMGQYALAIRFSDGHQTGIYNFRDLREDCPCEICTARRSRREKTDGGRP